MGWGFRKSIKIAPGVRLNVSKSGVSTSIGGKGFTYNSRGRVTASIPGTGIRFTQNTRATRTSNPVRSVVAGSGRVDSASTERLSKREQAARDFVAQVQERTTNALLLYFMSHGVYVRREDLADAVTLEEHQGFLETLALDFEATTKAIKLAVDIGSISLAEKEKAMLAVYEVERKCSENLGDRGQLANEAATLASVVRSWPVAPTLTAPLVVGLMAAFLLFMGGTAAGLILFLVSVAFGGFSLVSFSKKKTAAANTIADANERFDALLAVEVSGRPALGEIRDNTHVKAIGFGILLVAVSALAWSYRTPIAYQPATVTQGGDKAVASSSSVGADTALVDGKQLDFGWMVGKLPADVVTDKRFRATFNHASKADWKRFVDRLAVANSRGIELRDGFLVGQGCKAGACGSDAAAFAIDVSTGKGDFVFRETVDHASGKAIIKRVTWKDLPLDSTPLAEWVHSTETEAALNTAALAPTQPTLRTSFDCSKAHSDAEHLICTDAQLAAADVELAAIYTKAKAAVTDQVAFKARTLEQWNYREKACHDRECLARWYADQRTVLQHIAETGDAAAE
ncbi:DUF4236 domain-containing protein [Burkholderia ambifaria]|uniref:DUF4236 domain-containing protein n=1 Tax=Burkholderia ambifaria TaxID=152480 RepID=UPI002FE3A7F9